jgi:hypothetical protein
MHLHRSSRTLSLQLGTALALLAFVPTSQAGLGGDAAALATEQSLFGASFAVTQSSLFSVHSLTTPSGVHIRQYVGTSGLVFAVAWDGPVLPDLEALLGSSYTAYQEGQRKRGRGVHIQTPALVLESAGMMRAFYGKALLPDRLPMNVSARDIQ